MHWINAAAALALAITGTAAAQMPAVPAAPPAQVQPRFVVVLDPAHGGSDIGAHLQNGLMEKQITLALSQRLGSALRARGIEVVATRVSDQSLPALNRAETANHAQAAACLVLHATATGSGVHLYTSSLAPVAPARLLPWPTAQAAWVAQSLRLEAEIDTALAHTQVPVTLGRASVPPMDNLTCPTVAVEIAPLVAGHVTAARDLGDAAYQKSVVDSLAAALESWQNDWKQ
ncbi:MAG TPA: N-acetylmuramoyl-L-alanine amidase [Acidobacteriaceae bacterium]|jgi:N-acetylmuramoyl-L-alanine amidase|nr:N-acetylmuramoyl-L-alanine amidase [Acidobacteriaceae bacterium]